MTSTEISSEDSGVYGSKHQRGRRGLSAKVDDLASQLQETNTTLTVVDKMLEEYKGLGEQKASNVNKLRKDLHCSRGYLQDERLRRSLQDSARSLRQSDLEECSAARRHQQRRSSLQDYDQPPSDVQYGGGRRRTVHSAVRFFDDMDVNRQPILHHPLQDLPSRRHNNEVQSGSSVDHRLQSIEHELRQERATLRRREEEVSRISSDLKEALEQQKCALRPVCPPTSTPGEGQLDFELRTRLIQTEAQKAQVEGELANIRRRMNQAEGGRDALLEQTEELRHQLSRSELEKQRLLEQQEADVYNRRKRTSVDYQERDHFKVEKHRLQEEVADLRAQITKSARIVGDYSKIQHELEKSEKQRIQLSDHIQVLNKDLAEKEKQSLQVMAKLQELTSRYQDADRQSASSLAQLEDALSRLRDASQSADMLAAQLKDVQRCLMESEKKREKIKNSAQEMVRQWKVKCKKLECELGKQHETTRISTERNSALNQELEKLRDAASSSSHQVELFKRQLSELLSLRAQMDERLRIQDIEVNELKSSKMDLECDLRDCKVVIERLEHELRMVNEKTSVIYDESKKSEDQIGSLQTSNIIAQNQLRQLQNDIKQVSIEKVEATAHVAELTGERNDMRSELTKLRISEAAARSEIEKLNVKMKEEKDQYEECLERIKVQMEQYKAREAHIISELSQRYKKDVAEYEAEVQALRISVQDERSSSKLQWKQQEKLKAEIERLHQDLALSEEETEAERRKYQKIKEEILTRAQMTEDGLSRVNEMELQLLGTRETLSHVEKDYQNILHSIGVEMDAVVGLAALNCPDMSKVIPIRALPTDPHNWLVQMKGKLGWLQAELRAQHVEKRQQVIDKDVGAIVCEEDSYYINERHHQEDVINATLGQDHAERDSDKIDNLVILEDHQETQQERARINERYARLQETMSSLREELATSHSNDKTAALHQIRSATPPVRDTPSYNFKRIGTQDFSPTDEEFESKTVHPPIIHQ